MLLSAYVTELLALSRFVPQEPQISTLSTGQSLACIGNSKDGSVEEGAGIRSPVG